MSESKRGQGADEVAVDEWLAGDSPLSRRYAELGDDQPPAELDRKILASAAEASKVVPLERTTRRWGASIAVAATVLLCVSIVVNLSIQPEGPLLGEAPPQVEFADEPETARASSYSGEAASGAGRLDELRRQSQPAMAPPPAMNEVIVEPAPARSLAADETPLPDRASLGAGIDAPAARPSLAPPPRIDPELLDTDSRRDDTQMARAIALLRTRNAGDKAGLSALATAQRQAEASPAREEQLDAILSAWEADDAELAWNRLQAFLRDYPDHPFSREFSEQE